MASAFEQILDLKKRKEEQAQTEVRRARLALEQAARAVEQRREEAEAFSRHLSEHQTKLYDTLETKVRALREVHHVREEIAYMRERQAGLYKKVDEAEADRTSAAQALQGAQQAHLQTVKNVEKFKEIVTIEHRDAVAAEQAGEDREMEEFVRLGEPAEF
jgi:hypothetical protein